MIASETVPSFGVETCSVTEVDAAGQLRVTAVRAYVAICGEYSAPNCGDDEGFSKGGKLPRLRSDMCVNTKRMLTCICAWCCAFSKRWLRVPCVDCKIR